MMRRAEAARKYRMTSPEHADLVKKIADKVYEENEKQKAEVIKKVAEETTPTRINYRPLDDFKI
jgi:hypothetical protein